MKRIMREARELRAPTDQYSAHPLEDNVYEWHFTIAGPAGTAFEGGRYHGRILLPTEYPMKPPSIIMLTPNGRFVVGQKICLTISAHHPESWQPSWSIRTMLLAIITFLPTEGKGAIAALDYTDKERKDLAAKSLNWQCPKCKQHMRNALCEKSATVSDADRAAVEEMRNIGFQLAPRSRQVSEADGGGPDRAPTDGDDGSAAGPPAAVAGIPVPRPGGAGDGDRDGGNAANDVNKAAAAAAGRGTAEPAPSRPVDHAATPPARTAVAVADGAASDWSIPVAIAGVLLAILVLLLRKASRDA